jgi:hypothetical protein
MRLWGPSETCMSIKKHIYALKSLLMTEQMKNQMMTTMMKLLMSMAQRMETCMAAMVMAMTAVKVVVLALQLVATMIQPPLAVQMVDPVMFPRNNEPKKFQTREYRLKTFHLHQIQMPIPRFLMLPFQQ